MRLLSRRAAVVIAIGVAVADTALLWPPAAVADAPTGTGSWQVLRQSTPLGALPPTSTTADHDLPVQNSPAGVLAFSALRYSAGGAVGGVLTLSISGQQPTDPPAIDLCPITSSWKVGSDQVWSARPSYDCAHAVVGAGNPSQMTWEIGPELLASGRLDVALTPDPTDRTPYAVTFSAPDDASFDPVAGPKTKPLAASGGTSTGTGAPATPPPPAATTSSGSIPTLGSTSVRAGDADQPPAVAAPDGLAASAAAPTAVTHGPASRALGAGALAGFALLLLLRSFVTVGTKGHTPRSLIPTSQGES
jgi:hypothetical protein